MENHTTMIQILCCPFCGGDAGLIDVNMNAGLGWCVQCQECGARGPSSRDDGESAIGMWNTRAGSKIFSELESLGMSSKEFVLSKYPDAVCEKRNRHTKSATAYFVIQSKIRTGLTYRSGQKAKGCLGGNCSTEEDAWDSAGRRIKKWPNVVKPKENG